jgi:hypothetical protein
MNVAMVTVRLDQSRKVKKFKAMLMKMTKKTISQYYAYIKFQILFPVD